jgi:hypothetical protein
MKAIIEFNLPEDEIDHYQFINGKNAFCSLWDLDQHLRYEIKYNDALTEEQINIYYKVSEKLHCIMREHNISLEGL